jgi:lysophospholipase L1-like esterase
LIKNYAVSKSLACVDLFSATADPADGQLASVYSNDGLHLTTAGYRLFAEEVGHVLKAVLNQAS